MVHLLVLAGVISCLSCVDDDHSNHLAAAGSGSQGGQGGQGIAGGAASCDEKEEALAAFVSANASCSADSECRYVNLPCLYLGRELCGGDFFINAETDLNTLEELNAELELCSNRDGASCPNCGLATTDTRCNDSGRCTFEIISQ